MAFAIELFLDESSMVHDAIQPFVDGTLPHHRPDALLLDRHGSIAG